MKTDSIFYQIFQTAPELFFELIGRSAMEASGYAFRSVEIKQTAFRIDGVLLPSKDNATVYFSEVQFQKDEQLYHRFFAEVFLYLAQYPHTCNWQGVLIYARRSLQPQESQLFQELLDSPRVRQIYLDELGDVADLPIGLGLAKLVVEPERTAPEQAKRLIDQARRVPEGGLSSQAIIELIETIIVYKFTKLSREEIEVMLGLSELKQTKVYQEALEEGRYEVVKKLLQARFGDLDEGLTHVAEALSDESSAELVPLLLNLSREELVERFSDSKSESCH